MDSKNFSCCLVALIIESNRKVFLMALSRNSDDGYPGINSLTGVDVIRKKVPVIMLLIRRIKRTITFNLDKRK